MLHKKQFSVLSAGGLEQSFPRRPSKCPRLPLSFCSHTQRTPIESENRFLKAALMRIAACARCDSVGYLFIQWDTRDSLRVMSLNVTHGHTDDRAMRRMVLNDMILNEMICVPHRVRHKCLTHCVESDDSSYIPTPHLNPNTETLTPKPASHANHMC